MQAKHATTDERTAHERRPGRMVLTLLVIAISLFVAACGGGDDDDEKDDPANAQAELEFPETFPAFGESYLTALPREHWITNGGTVFNQRFSPLDEINDGNVKDLKAEWKLDLQSGTEAKYSHEAQPIVYGDTAYVPTGEDDVFAIDIESGETKWKYEGELDPNISTVCCGWLSRGVGIGEGKVFIGKLDGMMVALDQETGEVEWETEVTHWKKANGGITHAPLYYDGMVYTGITGGEFGVRGKVVALDADTGEEEWTFFTTAGPDDESPCNEGDGCETAGESWEGDSYLTGGAPVWQTPSVDPELGMLYFTTGNANPDVDGSERGGANLYAASFVALDLKTGEYEWHYQTVHHDIWDYDQPSPTILYDAEIDGETVPAIAQAAKTGWLYALNRETGEPIWDIKETPVAQNKQQKTHATQPIPQYEGFADHDISDVEFNSIKKLVAANPEGKGLKVIRGDKTPEGAVFNPAGDGQVTVVAPGATGGTNWPPSSYNPEEDLIFVCSLDGVSGIYPSGVEEFVEGQVRLGSILTVLPFGSTQGHLTAIDSNTGEIKWKFAMEDKTSCYSGSTTTAGNLVFVGQNDGRLLALSADEGEKLWEFQTGAGANSTVTTFEKDGKQYVMFVAGGNSLAASPHGDNLWLFSLEGTGESLKGIESGAAKGGVDHFDNEEPQGEGDGEDPTTDEGKDAETSGTKKAGDIANGESIFAANCSVCHGLSGKGAQGGPPVTGVTNVDQIMLQVAEGGSGMPAFGDQLSEQEVIDVATYVAESLAN